MVIDNDHIAKFNPTTVLITATTTSNKQK